MVAWGVYVVVAKAIECRGLRVCGVRGLVMAKVLGDDGLRRSPVNYLVGSCTPNVWDGRMTTCTSTIERIELGKLMSQIG